MIPNNNLSVLPWYTSIDQQNARKWWVYGRIYPLFTPTQYIPPFQVMRENTLEALESDEFFYGYIANDGTRYDWDGSQAERPSVEEFDVHEYRVVRLNNIPPPFSVPGVTTVSVAIYDVDNNFIRAFTPPRTFPYTGSYLLPYNAYYMAVQTGNTAFSTQSGFVSQINAQPAEITEFEIFRENPDGTHTLVWSEIESSVTKYILPYIQIKQYIGRDVIVYMGDSPIQIDLPNGRYYCRMMDRVHTWYSDVFTVVGDISPYLKIEWWDEKDFQMDAGIIAYEMEDNELFHNVLYLMSDIAKPDYQFEEEGETRDGYFFPTKQISEKRYKFNFLAPEYLLDVMRFIRMSDHVQITKNGQVYNADTFLITPEWEDNGDVAKVEAEFDTATVAKKIGLAYIRARSFNEDFNNDYD